MNSRGTIAGIGELLWDGVGDSEQLGGAPMLREAEMASALSFRPLDHYRFLSFCPPLALLTRPSCRTKIKELTEI